MAKRAAVLAFLLLGYVLSTIAGTTGSQEKVYYEVPSHRAVDAVLAGVEDHLAASGGKTSIVVLAHGKGVDFLRDGALDRTGNSYRAKVQELERRGVQFRVCGTTLANRQIDPNQIIPEGRIVSDGGAELKRLREQGYKRLN